MKSTEFARLLLDRTPWNTPLEMSYGHLRSLLLCINNAIAEVRRKGSSLGVQEPYSVVLRPPTQVQATLTRDSTVLGLAAIGGNAPLTSDTNLITGDAVVWPTALPAAVDPAAWLDDALGSWLSLDGFHSRILTRTRLVWEWMGNTEMEAVATVTHDTVPLSVDTLEVADQLELRTPAGERIHTLMEIREEDDEEDRAPSTGEPLRYRILPLHTASGVSPGWFLRVSPAPDQEYLITGSVRRTLSRMVLEDLRTPRDLPMSEDLLSRAVVPTAILEMQTAGLLEDGFDASMVQASAARAVEVAEETSGRRDRAPRRARTRRGY